MQPDISSPKFNIKNHVFGGFSQMSKRCFSATKRIPSKIRNFILKSSANKKNVVITPAKQRTLPCLTPPDLTLEKEPELDSYTIQQCELQKILDHGIACYRVQLLNLPLYELYCEFTCAYWEHPRHYDPSPIFQLINFSDDYLQIYAPYMVEQLVYFAQGRYQINPSLVLKFDMPEPASPLPIEESLILIKQNLIYITAIQ